MNDRTSNEPSASRQFEDVLAQFLQAEEQGLRPDPLAYLENFPELADQLREAFHDRAWFDRLAPRLAPTSPTVAAGFQPAATAPLSAGSRFAGYEILSELGHGGMSIVYKARQGEPDRLVALKVIRSDRLGELSDGERRRWIGRFHREAQHVAALDLPAHIVTLHEVGEQDNQPYFTMRLIEGGSLAQRLRQAEAEGPQKAAERRLREQQDNARLLAQVAVGVDYAHRRGILHGDLKPANVLLDADGRPLVTDFGLARRLDGTGSLVAGFEGTAEYAAPEQARGAPDVTTAADVYALGAILYELLTGRPPFKGATAAETLLHVLTREPMPPRQTDRRLSRDLETICLKCLEKEPQRRCSSAAALADDLENWLAGRPINARPAGRLERGWRWCRRNPVPAVAAATILAVVAIAFLLIAASRTEAITSRNRALALAEDKTELADANGRLAREKDREARNAREQEKKARREATLLAFQQAGTLADRGEVGRAMHVLAHGLALTERAGAADLERVFRANLASWRYHLHALRRVLPHPAGVSAVAWSPDGRTLATACWDRTTRLWDAATARPRGEPVKHKQWITGLVFSSDGRTLLTVGYSKVGVWEVETSRRLAELDHKSALVTAAAFAPDGHTVVTGSTDGTARLWDCRKPQQPEELSPRPGWIEAVAFDPGGRVFATGGRNGRIVVWSASTHRPVASLEHPGGVNALALGSGGLLLSGGGDRTARLWNLTSGRMEAPPLAHQAAVKAVALSPDGRLALTGSLDRTARVWDTATGQAIGQPLAHADEVLAVAFGPDGRTVATGYGRQRGDARLWDVALGNPLGGSLTHTGSILTVAVSPDGTRVATASRDRTARLWDALTGEPVGGALRHSAEVKALAFSPDGETLVSGGNGVALFWQAATGRPVLRQDQRLRINYQLAVGSADRARGMVATWSDSPAGRKRSAGPFWGVTRGKSSGEDSAFTVAIGPDGKKLLTAGRGGAAVLWDVQWGARVPSMRLEVRDPEPPTFGNTGAKPDLYAAAFSPDGRLVAVAGEDGTVRLWDAAKYAPETFVARAATAKGQEFARLWDEASAARPVGGPLLHAGPVVALAFSPDGKMLLTGCGDGTARLWDVHAGKARQILKHRGPVVAVAFSPDGQTLLTGSWDAAARVWKTASGELAFPPLSHQGKVLAVAFSRDGHMVLTGSEDRTARLWDAATGNPIGPPLRHRDQVRAVAFCNDGRTAVTAGDDREGRLWPVPSPAMGSADRIQVWVEALTGMRRGEDGSIHLLERVDWERAVARSGQSGQEPVGPEDRSAWHRQEARAAEAAGRWLAARWHLDRLLAASPTSGSLFLRRGKAAMALGEFAAAHRDLDRAVALLPAEWEPWSERGRLAIREGRWQDSIDDLSKALERRKDIDEVFLRGSGAGETAAILHGRGFARASLGQWKEAAADLGRANTGPAPWADCALVLLKMGDTPGYAAICRRMLASFSNPRDKPGSTITTTEFGQREIYQYGKPFDPEGAVRMAWVCCLSPDALSDFALPLRLARQAASLDKESYPFARAFGAALYRAKEYEAAVKQLDASRALRKEPSPSVWLFLAMAHQRCGRKDQAREWLVKARGWIEETRKRKSDGAADKGGITWKRLPWNERLALELLQGEAEKLMAGKAPKP